MQKQYREIAYTVIIFVGIPLLVVANTLYLMQSVRKAFSEELRRKADLVNVAVAESLRGNIVDENNEEISQALDNLVVNEPTLAQLSVIREIDGSAVRVAESNDVEGELNASEALRAKIVFATKSPIAERVNADFHGVAAQAWSVASPLIDPDTDKVLAVVNSYVVSSDAEELLDKVLMNSYIVLTVSVVVIVLLLYRHLRFARYVELLAKEKEVNQTMADFLSVATHELKAPTAVIKGFTSNIIDMYGDKLPEEVKEPLNSTLAQTDRLNSLVQDLLNVSRIEQGRIEYKLTTVNLNEAINLLVKNFEIAAKEKSIEIIYNPDKQYLVHADAGRVQEIFTNLIDNAIKYSAKGSVVVSHESKGNSVVTVVRDSGIGMSQEQRKRLFQRFYRIQSDQTKGISGTGLGLWIIKQYIESMGGKIEVDSMPGAGSQFSVTLPIGKPGVDNTKTQST